MKPFVISLSIFFTLGLLLSSCATQSVSKKELAHSHLRLGTDRLQEGNYPAALTELLKSVELDPKNPIAHNNLALAYYVRDKHQEALNHLRIAIDLNSKYTDARNNLGRVYISLKMYDDAIRELTTVAEDLTYPTPEKGQANLALAHFQKGDYIKARDYAMLALKSNKEFCPAQATYGQSLFFLEDFDKAARIFDRMTSACEVEKEMAHYYAGLCHFRLGSKSKAIGRMEQAVSLFPEGEYTEKAQNMLKIMK